MSRARWREGAGFARSGSTFTADGREGKLEFSNACHGQDDEKEQALLAVGACSW